MVNIKKIKNNPKGLEKIADLEIHKTLAEQYFKIKYFDLKSRILEELTEEMHKIINDEPIDVPKIEKIHTIVKIID